MCATAAHAEERDGQHDFDWAFGSFKEHTRRLRDPLSGSKVWYEVEGYSVVRPLLGGRANFVEYEGQAPQGPFTLISVRVYDPASHQWHMNFATPSRGALWPTSMAGTFSGTVKDGRGDFYSLDEIGGRVVLVRFSFIHSATESRSEQAFSTDGGKTWETNWINTLIPVSADEAAAHLKEYTSDVPRSHDFDFEHGEWKTALARLDSPLTHSRTWKKTRGTWNVHPFWNGRGNLVELDAEDLHGFGLRLFNPESKQWSLNWVGTGTGDFGRPTVGEFKNGRGEFTDSETFRGREILIRNVWSEVRADHFRFEQGFSADGGRTWETNWISTQSREHAR